jgi:hypothetical protein
MGASVSAPDWPRNGAKLQGWISAEHDGWVKVDHPKGFWLPISQVMPWLVYSTACFCGAGGHLTSYDTAKAMLSSA